MQFLLKQVNESLQSNKTEKFYSLTFHKYKQTYDYLQTILVSTRLFHKISRQERGLINAVGKVNKWLFGSLDSDDEVRFNKYLSTLSNNQKIIQDDMKSEFSVLNDVIKTYSQQIEKLSYNQKLMLNKLRSLEDSEKNIAHYLYISLVLDNMMFQLNTINQIINNLETAISFAHSNVMHNSILNPNQLREMIKNIQNLYGVDHVPKFNELIDYYKYLSVQLIIRDEIILFSIHTPIVFPSQYTLYKVYPIPTRNRTLSVSHPYILLTKEEFWTTKEECPQLEDVYVCQQDALTKEDACLFELLTSTGNNTCPLTSVTYSKTSIHRLNGEEILVIPHESVTLRSQCQESIFQIKDPSVVVLPNCPIKIQNRIFEKEKSSDYKYILELPEFTYSYKDKTLTELQLQEVNLEELNKAQEVLAAVQFHSLKNPGVFINHWTIPVFVIFLTAIIVVLVYFAHKLYKKKKPRRSEEERTTRVQLEDRKIDEPLFSELREGGDM